MVLARNGVRPRPPPTMTSKARFARAVAVQPQRQIVDAQSRAVVRRGADRDLELARHEREFGMQRDVLADDLGPDARILDLVGRDAGPLVGRDIADAIAAGLHAVHADAGQIGHGVGQFFKLDPVILDVLPRGEMAVAAVVFARDMGQHAQLRRRQRAVGNGGAQHIGVKLEIDSVHQPQRLEFFLGQFARQPARDLIAEFRGTLGDQRTVEGVVDVHRRPPCRLPTRTTPAARWSGRRGG
jgi:hypothetical protein